jgi:hypothetical protein
VRLVACLSFVALVAVSGAGAAGTSRPSLTLVSGSAPHLRGSHFTPGSVVRIVETGPKVSIFKVRASRAGTFTLAVPQSGEACGTWVVQAIGVHGERASFGLGSTQCGEAGIGGTDK